MKWRRRCRAHRIRRILCAKERDRVALSRCKRLSRYFRHHRLDFVRWFDYRLFETSRTPRPDLPVTYPGQQFVNAIVALAIIGLGAWFVAATVQPPDAAHAIHLAAWAFPALLGVALLLGVLFVLPIGGADMPVVISLLNLFTGLAVAIAGFELGKLAPDHLRRACRCKRNAAYRTYG